MVQITREDLLSINKDMVESGGGVGYGEQPPKHASSLISRVENAIYYGEIDGNNPLEVACYWAMVISRGHVFKDANKRTGLAVMLSYLNVYNVKLNISQSKLAALIVELAQGKIDHVQLMMSLT